MILRTFGLTYSQKQLVPPVSADWNQLVYASKGVLTVRTEDGAWVVPPHRAVWIPANLRSQLEVSRETALRMLYLRSGVKRPGCAVVSVSPLLRELILRAVSIGALERSNPIHVHLEALIREELRSIDTVPLQLPLPQSQIAKEFVAAIEPAFDVDSALAHCGASRRTIERLFRSETSMSLGQWIRRRKLLLGLQWMVEGETSGEVAFRLGYNGPSAFIAMFKRELGSTPGNYLAP